MSVSVVCESCCGHERERASQDNNNKQQPQQMPAFQKLSSAGYCNEFSFSSSVASSFLLFSFHFFASRGVNFISLSRFALLLIASRSVLTLIFSLLSPPPLTRLDNSRRPVHPRPPHHFTFFPSLPPSPKRGPCWCPPHFHHPLLLPPRHPHPTPPQPSLPLPSSLLRLGVPKARHDHASRDGGLV